ncbi:MAG: diguanylate cyclase [Nitrospirota bacterium]
MPKKTKMPGILILDRDKDNLKKCSDFLIKKGYSVVTMSNARNAINIIKKERFDLLLLENNMGTFNGIEIMGKISQSLSQMTIILMQQKPEVKDVISSLKGGAFDFLIKPFDSDKLEEAITNGLENRKSFFKILNLSNRLKTANIKLKSQKQILQQEKNLLIKWNKDLNLLNELNRNVVGSLNTEEIVDTLLSKLKKVISYDCLFLYLFKNNKIWISSKDKMDDSLAEEMKRETIAMYGKNNELLSEDNRINRRNNTGSFQFYNIYDNRLKRLRGLEIDIPLEAVDKKIGIIRLIRFNFTEIFDDYQYRLLSMIASPLGLAIRNAEAHSKIRELANTDGLTNLLNKRTFHNIIERRFKDMLRYRKPLSLLLIDIDNFKMVNDQYGHQEGDKLLKTTASLLLKGIRETDIPTRYGGEEFAIILPETSLKHAEFVGNRIRGIIEGHDFQVDGNRVNITISIGISHCPNPDINNKEDLIRMADKALYRAKANGKNRVELSEDFVKDIGFSAIQPAFSGAII